MKNIMIKSAIATAVIAATTATTVAEVKVYGRIRTLVQYTDVDGGDSFVDLQDRSSRFGIKASGKISDGLTAFGKYEFRVISDRASLSAAAGNGQRLSYVGLKGGFGEISLGTRWSPFYLSTISYVDGTNAFGGTWSSCAGNAECTDFRNTNTINYKNKFGAAAVALQVQVNGDGGDDGNDVDEVSLGVDFKLGGATIGLGYLDTADVSNAFAIHGRTKFGKVSVAATYSTKDYDDATPDQDGFIVQAGYGFGGGKSVTLSYGITDSDSDVDPSEFALEYTHNMGAGLKWFAGFEIQDGDGGNPDRDSFGAGFRYDF